MKTIRGVVEKSEIYRINDHLTLSIIMKGETFTSINTRGNHWSGSGTYGAYVKMPEPLPRVDKGEEVRLFFEGQKQRKEKAFSGLQIIRDDEIVFSFSLGASLGSEVAT